MSAELGHVDHRHLARHGAGTVDVTVTTPNGTSATGSADHFTYVAAPDRHRRQPDGRTHVGGTAVTVTGTNLSGATSVNSAPPPAP